MKTLDVETLTHVTGGTHRRMGSSVALTQSLATIQQSISGVATNANNNQNSVLLPMVMMMALNRRPSPTIIAADGATVVSAG
jgi:hypothetical protein